MKLIQKVALLYLVAIGFMAWGIAVGRYEVFPFQILKHVQDFVEGDPLSKESTVLDKIVNDIGLEPRRYMRTYPMNARAGTLPVKVPQLSARREDPLVFIAPGHRVGLRVIFGALDFEKAFWGGVLLGPTGKSLHTWQLSTTHLSGSIANDELKNLYGVQLFRDGSVIFTQQEDGGGIVKVDKCSNVLWNLEGSYHHTISPTEDGYFWTFAGGQKDFDQKLAKVVIETGQIDTIIDMSDVRTANPRVHIFNLQANTGADDISHGNDITPLTTELSGKFEGFYPGDLLISYRTQNLIFVIDPDTLKLKWWRVGPWDRQHDADWEQDGTITVFSNNQVADRQYSDIVAIDPDSFEFHVIVDGESLNFYSEINGDQERTTFGTRMITSTTQGWAFEVQEDDEIVFSFVNNYEKKGNRSLNLSEAHRLPEDYFDDEFWDACEN